MLISELSLPEPLVPGVPPKRCRISLHRRTHGAWLHPACFSPYCSLYIAGMNRKNVDGQASVRASWCKGRKDGMQHPDICRSSGCALQGSTCDRGAMHGGDPNTCRSSTRLHRFSPFWHRPGPVPGRHAGQRHAGAARVCARAASEADVPGMLTWPRRPCTPRADSPAGPAERARAEGGVRVGVAPQAAPPAGHPIGRQRLPVAADHGQRLHLVPRPRGPAVRALVVRPQIRPSSAVSALPHPTADFEELLQPWSTPGLLRGVTVEPEPQV